MIKVERRGNIEIVSLGVETLNALVSEEIKNKIKSHLENGISKAIINLSGVKYVDSSGFGCLLSISRNAKNNFTTLKFCCIEPEVMKVLEMLQLHTVFTISGTLEESLASF